MCPSKSSTPGPTDRPDFSYKVTSPSVCQVMKAQAIRRRAVTAEAQLQAWARSRGTSNVQSGTARSVSPGTSVFPSQYHSTSPIHKFNSSVTEAN